MIRDNVATLGKGPVWDDVHVGLDGQLWVWESEQVIVATSGAGAVHFAETNGWPERLIRMLKRLDPQRKR